MKKPGSIVQADTEDGQAVGEAMVETIENQIRDNDPPETKAALKRLMKLGETRENAIRYFACALSVEFFEMLQKDNLIPGSTLLYRLRSEHYWSSRPFRGGGHDKGIYRPRRFV